MNRFIQSPRPFLLDVLLLLAMTSLLGLLISLLSSVVLSNVYFIAGVLFLLVSVVPVFTEMGGNARMSRRARKEGKNPVDIMKEQEKSGKYSRGTRITFLFGLSGFICFFLAILTI